MVRWRWTRKAKTGAICLIALLGLLGSGHGGTDIQAAGVPNAGTDGTLAASLNLGAAQPIFHAGQPDALGMTNVPDQHLAVMQQPDGSYRLWISGVVGGSDGSTGLLTTSDFTAYKAVAGSPTGASPVLTPSCPGRPGASSCWSNYDAGYSGANLVFTASNGPTS